MHGQKKMRVVRNTSSICNTCFIVFYFIVGGDKLERCSLFFDEAFPYWYKSTRRDIGSAKSCFLMNILSLLRWSSKMGGPFADANRPAWPHVILLFSNRPRIRDKSFSGCHAHLQEPQQARPALVLKSTRDAQFLPLLPAPNETKITGFYSIFEECSENIRKRLLGPCSMVCQICLPVRNLLVHTKICKRLQILI